MEAAEPMGGAVSKVPQVFPLETCHVPPLPRHSVHHGVPHGPVEVRARRPGGGTAVGHDGQAGCHRDRWYGLNGQACPAPTASWGSLPARSRAPHPHSSALGAPLWGPHAGKYRTGKSFLLNCLLGRQSGFVVGPTVEPCTKGIWIWGEPRAPRCACAAVGLAVSGPLHLSQAARLMSRCLTARSARFVCAVAAQLFAWSVCDPVLRGTGGVHGHGGLRRVRCDS